MTGCVKTRELAYFQSESNAEAIQIPERFIPTIAAGDVISVQVSSLNPEASTMFNPYTTIAAIERVQNTPPSGPAMLPYAPGYLVSPDGTIELPMLGKVAVAGLTTAQARDKIRTQLTEYLKEPTVNVRNQNFRISVLGEVSRPSLYVIPNEQITLTEALGLAGDVTIYGKRNNVLVIREENGQKTFTRIDMTRRDLFRSPYYYLRPNDIVYVEPGSARAASIDQFYRIMPIILSALSFVTIIATR